MYKPLDCSPREMERERYRAKQQVRFVLCWGLLLTLALGACQILQLFGLKPTKDSIVEVNAVDGTLVKKARVFTAWEAYDKHALEVIGVISVLIALGEWCYAKSGLLTLARFTFIGVGVVGTYWLFGEIARTFPLRPSGHLLFYVSCSYLHFHNGRCLATKLQWPLLAWLLLLHVPYLMYCAVWTILVYHTGVEVGIGTATALGLTCVACRLRLDRD